MSTSSPGASSASRLLELPAELRNRIFETVILRNHRLHISNGQSEYEPRALLGTCSQIYRETSLMFYSRNRFGYEARLPDFFRKQSDNLISWLKRIGGRHRGLLTDIHIWLNDPDSRPLPDLLIYLKKLNLRCVRAGVWLPPTVLRLRVEAAFLHEVDLAGLTKVDERALEAHDCWKPKDPSIRQWMLVPEGDVSDEDDEQEGEEAKQKDFGWCRSCHDRVKIRHDREQATLNECSWIGLDARLDDDDVENPDAIIL